MPISELNDMTIEIQAHKLCLANGLLSVFKRHTTLYYAATATKASLAAINGFVPFIVFATDGFTSLRCRLDMHFEVCNPRRIQVAPKASPFPPFLCCRLFCGCSCILYTLRASKSLRRELAQNARFFALFLLRLVIISSLLGAVNPLYRVG